MKRVFILFALPILLLRLPVMAHDDSSTPATTPVPAAPAPSTPAPSTAATIAAKEDTEERYKRLAADLQAVQSDNEALHAKITSMAQEIQTLREAQARPADNSTVLDELKRLAEKIQEVDKKRLEDKDAISEEIRKLIPELQRSLGGGPTPIHSSPAKPAPVVDSPAINNGFSYTVQKGQTLGAIVNAYNADFKSKGMKTITLKQAMEANPNVDWTRLRVGQKIVIPRPDGG